MQNTKAKNKKYNSLELLELALKACIVFSIPTLIAFFLQSTNLNSVLIGDLAMFVFLAMMVEYFFVAPLAVIFGVLGIRQYFLRRKSGGAALRLLELSLACLVLSLVAESYLWISVSGACKAGC